MEIYGGLCPNGHKLEVLGVLGESLLIYCPEGDYVLCVPIGDKSYVSYIKNT